MYLEVVVPVSFSAAQSAIGLVLMGGGQQEPWGPSSRSWQLLPSETEVLHTALVPSVHVLELCLCTGNCREPDSLSSCLIYPGQKARERSMASKVLHRMA